MKTPGSFDLGENALHMAIVNEDPAMVKFLLGKGADYHQRAYGNFFTPDDQKAERRSNLQHEWFDVPVETNYDGQVSRWKHFFIFCFISDQHVL